MWDLKNHLDSDEKIILFFRPSRKAYILQYILLLALTLGSIALFSYSAIHKTTILFKFLFYFSIIALAFALIMVLRLEYRIWSRRYALTNQRLMYSAGIFTERFKSANYAYITDIELYQSFWDKIMNTGTVKINTAGTDRYEIRYRKISAPIDLKKKINDLSQPQPSAHPTKPGNL